MDEDHILKSNFASVAHDAELVLYRNGADIPGDLLKLEDHTGSGRLYCHMYGEGHLPNGCQTEFCLVSLTSCT